MEWYSIDRIENGFAVVERSDKSMKNIPLPDLPDGIREGDVLSYENGKYSVDKQETDRRRKAAEQIQKKLFNK